VRIKKKTQELCFQLIVAAPNLCSTTNCCFWITLSQCLWQNSVLSKIKLEIKLYKSGGNPKEFYIKRRSASFNHQSWCTVSLSLHRHSSCVAFKEWLWRGYSFPNRGNHCLWTNVQQLCTPATLPIMIKYTNLDHHTLDCLGHILHIPPKREFVPSQISL